MSNVGMDKHGRVDNVKMTLPCKGEYVGVARLTLSAIANRMGFNIEEIEGGLGIFIIKTLMDEVELYSKIGEGSQIKMVKYLGDGR